MIIPVPSATHPNESSRVEASELLDSSQIDSFPFTLKERHYKWFQFLNLDIALFLPFHVCSMATSYIAFVTLKLCVILSQIIFL